MLNQSLNPRFLNKRAEMAWEAKEFVEGVCELPEDEKFAKECNAVSYEFNKRGRILLPSKEEIMGEFGISPDRFDAFTYLFAFPIQEYSEAGVELDPRDYAY